MQLEQQKFNLQDLYDDEGDNSFNQMEDSLKSSSSQDEPSQQQIMEKNKVSSSDNNYEKVQKYSYQFNQKIKKITINNKIKLKIVKDKTNFKKKEL